MKPEPKAPPPLPGTAIIVDGKAHEVLGQRVKTWHETGLQLRPGDGWNRPRTARVTDIVLHWTGGENPARAVFGTLKRRGYGCHFVIERDGTIVQFADPAKVATAHAGGFNASSVGIEIVNYGVRRFGPRPDSGGKLPSLWQVPKLGRGRPTHLETIHGKRVRVADFYPPQRQAVVWLCQALRVALDIDLASFPRDDRGELLTGTMPLVQRATFRGVCGHYNLTPDKLDPGVELLRYCVQQWNT